MSKLFENLLIEIPNEIKYEILKYINFDKALEVMSQNKEWKYIRLDYLYDRTIRRIHIIEPILYKLIPKHEELELKEQKEIKIENIEFDSRKLYIDDAKNTKKLIIRNKNDIEEIMVGKFKGTHNIIFYAKLLRTFTNLKKLTIKMSDEYFKNINEFFDKLIKIINNHKNLEKIDMIVSNSKTINGVDIKKYTKKIKKKVKRKYTYKMNKNNINENIKRSLHILGIKNEEYEKEIVKELESVNKNKITKNYQVVSNYRKDEDKMKYDNNYIYGLASFEKYYYIFNEKLISMRTPPLLLNNLYNEMKKNKILIIEFLDFEYKYKTKYDFSNIIIKNIISDIEKEYIELKNASKKLENLTNENTENKKNEMIRYYKYKNIYDDMGNKKTIYI